jgi:hypothetical protein
MTRCESYAASLATMLAGVAAALFASPSRIGGIIAAVGIFGALLTRPDGED